MAIDTLDDMEKYLDSLSDEDVDDIEWVVDERNAASLRLNLASKDTIKAADNVDDILKDAPSLSAPVTIYKSYKTRSDNPAFNVDFRSSGTFLEDAFLTGSTEKPATEKDSVVLAIKIPKGTKVLVFDDAYLLPRGLLVDLSVAKNGDVLAILTADGSLAPHVMINTTPWGPITHGLDKDGSVLEFHLPGQHDQSSHGGGGGGGRGASASRNRNRGGGRPDNRPKGGIFDPRRGGRPPGGRPPFTRNKAQRDKIEKIHKALLITAAAIGIAVSVLTISEKRLNIEEKKQRVSGKKPSIDSSDKDVLDWLTNGGKKPAPARPQPRFQ